MEHTVETLKSEHAAHIAAVTALDLPAKLAAKEKAEKDRDALHPQVAVIDKNTFTNNPLWMAAGKAAQVAATDYELAAGKARNHKDDADKLADLLDVHLCAKVTATADLSLAEIAATSTAPVLTEAQAKHDALSTRLADARNKLEAARAQALDDVAANKAPKAVNATEVEALQTLCDRAHTELEHAIGANKSAQDALASAQARHVSACAVQAAKQSAVGFELLQREYFASLIEVRRLHHIAKLDAPEPGNWKHAVTQADQLERGM